MPVLLILLGALALAAALTLSAVLACRTLTFPLPAVDAPPVELPPVDADAVARHLAEAIRCRTITCVPGRATNDEAAFAALHERLANAYPRVHQHLDRQTFGWSMLYTWAGQAPDLPPAVFLAHQDVVPVDDDWADTWTHDPFGGIIADGCVWGRGALDMKGLLVGLLEAVEGLLAAGYQPDRTLMLAFGHDEEDAGRGAQSLAAWLAEQGIQPWVVLDEGGAVIEGVVPGVEGAVAAIGTAEKRVVMFTLSVTTPPGHASTPPPATSIGLLAAALARLEAHPMPASLAYLRPMIRHLGAAAPPLYRLVFANTWLFGSLARRMLAASPIANAITRTTLAPTVVSGGYTDNVLPATATARVNCRLLPGDDVPTVIAHLRRVIGDGRVQITASPDTAGGTPVSPVDDPAYASLARCIKQVFAGVPVVPYLMVGASDARHYTGLCPRVYRFQPMRLTSDDLARIHGIDERVPAAALAQTTVFYQHLMRTWGTA